MEEVITYNGAQIIKDSQGFWVQLDMGRLYHETLKSAKSYVDYTWMKTQK